MKLIQELLGLFEDQSIRNKYTPEQIIAAFTQMFEDTDDGLNGGECGDCAYIYNWLNNKFKFVGTYYGEGDENNLSHIAVKYKGVVYDGQGKASDEPGATFVPVKLFKGKDYFHSGYKTDDGDETASAGMYDGGQGHPEKSEIYNNVLTYLEKQNGN